MKGKILSLAAAVAALLFAGCEKQPSFAPNLPQPPEDCLLDPWHAIDASEYLITGEPGTCTVHASLGGTRSYLERNGDSGVSVMWTSGDSFSMYTRTSDGKNIRATFTTSDSGPNAEFSSKSVIFGYGPSYHSMYPTTTKFGYSEDTFLLGINIPNEQQAVPGGIAEGLNYAYAYTEEQSADLTFKNVLSLLRFRLSGPGAATLSSMMFKSTESMAGDFIIKPSQGIPYVSDTHFPGDVTSNTITFSGPFESGKDYYVAMLPGQRPITLVFSDSGGQIRTVYSSSSILFTRGHVADIGTIDIGEDFYDASQSEVPAAELYMESTSGYKPFSIVVVPDGFTKDELPDYQILARSAMDFLFDTHPYKEYKHFFNVWILSVASNESGASVTDGNGNVTKPHDTFFSSSWGDDDYGDMTVDETTLNTFVEATCPDIVNGVRTLGEVPMLVLINDERYGGICHLSGKNHRYCMVPYVFKGKRIRFSSMEYIPNSDSDPSAGCRDVTDEDIDQIKISRGDWRNLVLHEFGGHCIARLADEYWLTKKPKSAVNAISSHTWTLPFGLNISAKYSPTPWDNDLLSRRDQLIAKNPLYARIGTFQGGEVSIYNRWRSEFISCMDDNRQYFSTWQRELIVRHIYDMAGAPFNLSEFLSRDVIYDPLRDNKSGNAPDIYNPHDPIMEFAPLLPPVYSEDK